MTDASVTAETESASLFSSLNAGESVRGETPANIEARCLQLCKDYISGAWNLVENASDFTVKRITGGLTNQLYRVQLSESLAKNATVCTDVAVKLYQSKNVKNHHKDDHERFNDTIVNTIMSQIGIGPKVFGVFNEGMVQQFYEHAQFGPKHQKDPALLQKLVTSLATVHNLNVPIRKDPEAWLNLIESYFTTAYEQLNAQALIDELQLTNLQTHDPRIEFQKVRKWIKELNPPVVFCHNDFRGSNILVTKPNQDIILTDVESSAYGYRATDISSYIISWGWEAFDFENHQLPSDDILKHFIGLYVEACDQLKPGYSKKPENSIETILKEVKISVLENSMFGLAFMMQLTYSFIASVPFDAKSFMKHNETSYSKYLKIKQRLIDEKIIVD